MTALNFTGFSAHNFSMVPQEVFLGAISVNSHTRLQSVITLNVTSRF